MSEQLKLCPFCGGKAEIIETIFYDYKVACEECGASIPHCDSEEMAIKAWNRRKDEQIEYERASEQREHDILYEPTYNEDDGSM